MKNLGYHVIAASTLAILMGMQTAQAGFFDRLVDRVERGVENAVSGTVARKASNEAADATEAVISPKSQPGNDSQYDSQPVENANASAATSAPQATQSAPAPQAAPAAMPSAGGFGGMLQALQQKANYNDQYSFDLEVENEITSDGETNTMVQSYGEDGFMVVLEEDQKMVLDVTNQAMLMINDKERSVMAMSTQFMKQMAGMAGGMAKSQQTPDKISSIRKTGQSKQIASYLAHQWVFESDDGNGEMWMAESIDFDFVAFNKKLLSLFDDGSGQFAVDFTQLEGEFPMGLPLEMIGYKNGKVDHRSLTVRVNESPATLNLGGYTSQSMLGN